MKLAVCLFATFLAAPSSPAPGPDLASRLDKTSSLAGVKLGWRVADFIGEHAAKEDTETLGPDARGFRRFRVLPSARPKELDDVVVYFRENKVMLVAVTETRPIDDVGSWSRLVVSLSSQFGEVDTGRLPADRATMLLAFSLGDKGKALKMREFVAWDTPEGELGALWLEDAWGKKRTYVLTLSRVSPPQRDPRLVLRGLFTAEKAFFGEYNSYSTDLVSLGWQPEAGESWVYGFCNAHPADSIPGVTSHDAKRNHSLHPDVTKNEADKERLKALADPCAKLGELGLADRFQVTPHGFTAFAMGNADSDPDLEVWSINEVRNVELVRSDAN